MGQVVSIHQYQQLKQNRIKRKIFRAFPWQEVRGEYETSLRPLIEPHTQRQQLIIYEAFVRLLYESFSLGLQRGKTAFQECDRLAVQSMREFGLDRSLNGWTCLSLLLLFTTLSKQWIQKANQTIWQ
jgi:hypothetical protein